MNDPVTFRWPFSAAIVEQFGWVLLHSLWQFALVALIAGIAGQVMRRSSASARYMMLIVAMTVMIVAPAVTWMCLSSEVSDPLASRRASALGQGLDSNHAVSPGADASRLASDSLLVSDPEIEATIPVVAAPSVTSERSSETSPHFTDNAPATLSGSERTEAALRPWLAWIVVGWSLGVAVCSLRPLLGWHTLRRLKRVGVSPVSDEVVGVMRRVSERLGVRRAVCVLQSTLAQVPVVVGYLRPVVLLPVSLVTGLPAEQFEAILAHELAHVRRHDFVVNLLQTLVETFFFYHPAVWWLSQQIRFEREHCCDDLVVALLGNRVEYGRALMAVEELRGRSTVLALGVNDGSLLARVRRIVGVDADLSAGRWPITMLVAVGLVAAGITLTSLFAQPSPEKQPDDTADVAKVDSAIVDMAADTAVVRSGEWPMWGGSPHRNHVASGPMPVDFDLATGENVVWKATLGTATYSSPIVAGGKVFVGTNNGAGLDSRRPKEKDYSCLVCFDEATGKLLWQYASEKMPAGRVHDWPGIGLCSTACVVGDRVWFVTNRCEVVCIDTNGFRDGENDGPVVDEAEKTEIDADVVWKFDLFKVLGVRPLHQAVSSITMVDGLVLLNTSNGPDESHRNIPAPNAPNFLALNATTGQVVWQDTSAGESIIVGGSSCSCSGTSPAVATIGGVTQAIFAGREGWLYGFDFADLKQGKTTLLWRFDCNPKTAKYILGQNAMGSNRGRNTLVASPVVVGDQVYMATGRNPESGEGPGDLWCIDATKRGDISSELVFNKLHRNGDEPITHKAMCACDPDVGDFTRQNPNSGAVWHYVGIDLNGDGKLAFDESFHRSISSPAIHDGLLFIPDFSGLLHCVDAETGKGLWTHDLLSSCWSSCVIAGGHVLIGDEDGDLEIFKVARTKQPLHGDSPININHSIYATPALVNNTMLIATMSELIAVRDPRSVAGRQNPEPVRVNGQTALARGDYGAMEAAYQSLVTQEIATHEDALWLGHAQHLQGRAKAAAASYQLVLMLAEQQIGTLEKQTGPTKEQLRADDERRKFGGPVRDWMQERDRELARFAELWPQWVLLAGQVQLKDLGDAAGAAKTLARGLRFVPEAESMEALLKDAQAAVATKPQPFDQQDRWRTWLYPMATQRSLAMAYEQLGDHAAAAQCWCRFQLSWLAYQVGMANAKADVVEAAIAKVPNEKREPFHEFVLKHSGRKKAPPREFDIPQRLKTDPQNPFEVRSRLDGFQMMNVGPSQPSVMKFKNGSWLMVFTSGDAFQSRVMFARSADGKTWEKPYDFAHNGIFPTRSPVVIEDDDGTLWLVCSSQRLDPNRYSSGGYQWWVCSSKDGREWSTLKPLSLGDGRPFAGQYQHTAQLTRDRNGKFWIFCNEFAGSTDRLTEPPRMQLLPLGLDKNEHITSSFATFDADNRCHLAITTLQEMSLTSSSDMQTWQPRQVLQRREQNRGLDRPRLLVDGDRFVLFYQAGWGQFCSGRNEPSPDGGAAKITLSKPVSLDLEVSGSLVTQDGDDVLLIANEGYENSPPVLLSAKRSALLALPLTSARSQSRSEQDGVLLSDAVRDFNAENKQLGRGLDQPPLTEDEVIAAIKRGKWKDEVGSLNEREIASFKALAESRQLPKEYFIQVFTGHQPEAFIVEHYWQIQLSLPAIGHNGFVRCTIRNTKFADEKIDPKSIAWGKPDPDGLSLGTYLSPKKDQYQIGERVHLLLFVRNDGKKDVPVIWPNTSHPMPEVTDEKGAKVVVRIGHDKWNLKWISGFMGGGALPPGAAHAFTVPFEISIGGEGNKLIGRVIEARPGQTLKLKVHEPNGNNRIPAKNEPTPESGIVTFAVVAATDAVGANGEIRGQPREAPAKTEGPSQEARKSAISRGVTYLKSQQREDGLWPEIESQPSGVTALVTAALLQAGTRADEPAIQKALAYLRKTEPKIIYSVALQIMVFSAAAPKDDAELIRKHVAWIENAQVTAGDGTSRGGWSYQANPGARADGSCTRFAVLGLHAAQKAGFAIKRETWQRVAGYWLATQKPDGRWGYMSEASATPSMTLAGIAGLATASSFLPPEAGQIAREAALRRASEAISKDIPSLTRSTWPFYSLHCLERAGHLTNAAQFGDVDWKLLAMKQLIDAQREDGAWSANTNGIGGNSSIENPLIATSFALLVLTGQP